jgi:hypothetical protein
VSAPAFEFTHRAIPVIQMGRSARHDVGNRWQEGLWGSGLWGVKDWEVIWTDLACEVHEITTNTGRGGATDRFVPGTAAIVASNVNRISEIIFPQVPETGEGIELVPQPPVTKEEDLQAPTADTVVSNGWSFTDDFETAPPRWIFPAVWASTGAAPFGPFKNIDAAMEPELYDSSFVDNYSGNAAAQWTQSYAPDGNSSIAVVVTSLDWPATPTAGTPNTVIDLMVRMNHTTKECDVARFTFTPNFTGANTVSMRLFHMGPTGTVTADGGTTSFTAGTGTNGVFGARTLAANITFEGQLEASISGVAGASLSWSVDTPLSGGRVGFAVHYEQGSLAGVVPAPPRITEIVGEDFTDDLTRPLGSGWVLPRAWRRDYRPMIQDGGAMTPTQVFHDRFGGEYQGYAMAQWVSDFDGDQSLEIEVSNVSAPRPSGRASTQTYFELYTHGNKTDRACQVAYVNYDPGWGTTHSVISWSFWQYGPNGEIIDYAPSVSGSIDVGATNGIFPEPARWRVESDVTGEQRLYHNGVLLGTATAPNPEQGGRIGIHTEWAGDNDAPNSGRRPDVARIDQVWGGLRSPLGTEELGMWVRIGVDHQTLGQRWLFRGFVDALVPTYVPDHQDAVRIECVDALGEAGRVFVDGDQLSHRFASAPTRIRQVLDRASWPAHFRTVGDDSTLMSRPTTGKAVDLLTQVAESCGGAVYGDPYTGDVVFKGQDWQGDAAGGEVEAFITNYFPAEDDGILRVCPTGWERSSRRSDMCTRVRYQTVTSDTDEGEPIIREWRYPAGERLYGVEKYERTLLCITRERLDELGIRQLRLRQPNQFPRIEAVVLDAATATEALDLMTTVSFTGPSKVQCQLRRDGLMVFNRKMLVTGVRHRMTPTRWTCRLALDPSSAFVEVGGRWDEARWGHDEWGRTR